MDVLIRPVQPMDCRRVWEWRNHPDVRRMCFQQDPIGYDDHEQWFQARLTRPDVHMFIAETGEGEPLGQIRFEPDGIDGWQVHVNLNPAWIGRGIGADVIARGTERFLNGRPGQRVTARIRQENLRSVRAFVRGGYALAKAGARPDRNDHVYTRTG